MVMNINNAAAGTAASSNTATTAHQPSLIRKLLLFSIASLFFITIGAFAVDTNSGATGLTGSTDSAAATGSTGSTGSTNTVNPNTTAW